MANHLRRSKRRNHDQTLPSRDFFSSLLTDEKGHEQTHAPQQTNPCLPTTRPAAWRRHSPSCRSCCGERTKAAGAFFKDARVGNGDRRHRRRRSFAAKPPCLRPQRRWKRPQRLSAMTPSIRRTAIRKKTSVVNIAATPPAVPMPR
jgi:hypothetical protein